MKFNKFVYKKYYNLVLNGVSSLQIKKKNYNFDSSFIKLTLNFDKFKIKNNCKNIVSFELNKTVKSIRKQKGFPIHGQRTRSNSRTALYLRNKYVN